MLRGIDQALRARDVDRIEVLAASAADGTCAMQHCVRAVHQSIERVRIGEVTSYPFERWIRRRTRSTRERAHDDVFARKRLQQMCADETGGTGDRNSPNGGACRTQEFVPVALAALAASSDAAYMRRACDRDGLPEDVRGNACESTSSTWQ